MSYYKLCMKSFLRKWRIRIVENRRTFQAGDLVRHFKRETLDLTKPENKTRYLYRIIGVATHSETREALMIYQALYDDMGLFARPYDMFMEEVDHEKYPTIKQQYRFEKTDDRIL